MEPIQRFIRQLEMRNLSKNTIYNYSNDIAQFVKVSGKPLEEVTRQDVESFIHYLRKTGCTVATTNRKLSAIKTFFKFLVNNNIIPTNPAAEVDGGKKEQRLPKPIEEDEIETLLATIDNLRDRTLIELLYGTGIRREELANIQIRDINFHRDFIRIFGKGGKERIVPVHEKAMALIKELVQEHKSIWLFPSRKVAGNHISLRQINEIVTKWVNRAGLHDRKITPHSFRHSFCSHLYDNGADIKTIQDLAGHVNSNTTQIYTKVSISRNFSEYRRFHPRAKK